MITILAGLLCPVRGYWDAALSEVAGLPPATRAVVASGMALTGFQAAPVVRRGPEELRLIPGTRIDLDSRAPGWDAGGCAARCDVVLDEQGGGVEEAGGGELADKSATYHSCLAASDYTFAITPDRAAAGVEACGRTGDGRHAGMTVTRVEKSGDRVTLVTATVTVWEAPPVTVLRTDEEEPPLFQELPGDW